jgi:hypothetical protein
VEYDENGLVEKDEYYEGGWASIGLTPDGEFVDLFFPVSPPK